MSMEDSSQYLTPGARRMVDTAVLKQRAYQHPFLGLNHWLAALVERHAPMAQDLVPEFDPAQVRDAMLERLQQGDAGAPLEPYRVIEAAFMRARQRARSLANERDLAAVLLTAAGYTKGENTGTVLVHLHDGANEDQPRMLPTPFLDQFGRDLTDDAASGKLTGVVGRKVETDLVIETLCRRTKRNPVLIGPAGVGKTAIVEGLALRIAQGKAPATLNHCRVIAMQPSLLVAGASVAGELEKRMKAILQEASQQGILLFIDEIHTIMGAGGMVGTTDIGSMLKPALARGEIACIAATTDDEYRRFIESDTALERRFQPIRVHELGVDETLEVLRVLRDELVQKDGVCVDDEILRWLIDFAQQFMRNRHFPDKAVDLLEQIFAHAVALEKNCVDMDDAQQVAERMVGMPVISSERLKELEKALQTRRLLTDSEIHELVGRLQVTMRGLDMHTSRPNAVLLMAGEASENGQDVAETVAETLFGERDRVINIDFSRFTHSEDVTMLLGAPPGYVGYSDRIPLHRLIQIPWCVLYFERIDLCHPRIREVLAQALLDGWVVDGRGKTIYLSDAVVILTSNFSMQSHRGLGFTPETEQLTAEDLYQAIAARVGDSLAEQVDLYAFGLANAQGVSVDWLKESFLTELARRFQKQGVRLLWDATLVEWMAGHQVEKQLSEREWEEWVDRILAPSIIPFLPPSRQSATRDLLIKMEEDRVVVLQP